MERAGNVNSRGGELKHMRQKFGSDIHKGMAQEIFPNGSVLRCIPCGKQRPCSTSQIAEYLASGFPKCKVCNHVTDLVNPYLSK